MHFIFLFLSFCFISKLIGCKFQNKTNDGNYKNPKITKKVYFDISIDDKDIGKIVMGLYGNIYPKISQNFLNLCNNNNKNNYKGSIFHLVINKCMIQGGNLSSKKKNSSFLFIEKNTNKQNKILYNKPFLLSMIKKDENHYNSQFLINTVKIPWFNNNHIVFGEVTEGKNIISIIENIKTDKFNKPLVNIKIENCGEFSDKKKEIINKNLELKQLKQNSLVEKIEIQISDSFEHGWNNGIIIDDIEYPCTITYQNKIYQDCEIELHGGIAKTFPKKSYRIKFSKTDAPFTNFYGYNSEKEVLRRVVLKSEWIDPSFMRDKITHDLMILLGGNAPRSIFVELYVNDNYHGFYHAIERIDDMYFKHNKWNKNGKCYKASSHKANFQKKCDIDVLEGYEIKYPKKETEYTDLQDFYNILHANKYKYVDFKNNIKPFFNINKWIIYSLVHTYAHDLDGFDKNYYLYKDTILNLPYEYISWDSDATWGNNWDGTKDLDFLKDIRLFGEFNPDGDEKLSEIIFSIPVYYKNYLLQFKKLLTNGIFQPKYLKEMINAIDNKIQNYVIKDYEKWNQEFPDFRESYQDSLKRLIHQIELRKTLLLAQIEKEMKK